MTMYSCGDCIPHSKVGDDPLVCGSDEKDVDQDDLVTPIVSVSVIENILIKRGGIVESEANLNSR